MLQGNYFEAAVEDVDWQQQKVTCRYTKPFIGSQFEKDRVFEVPYDLLVVSVRTRYTMTDIQL